MRNNFNEFLKDFFSEDLFWSNSTHNPFLRGTTNNLPVSRREYSQNLPSTNVYEDEWSFRYELATPGFTKKELTVELENNVLTVSGIKKGNNKKETTGEYISKEYHSTKFYRSFPLPENVVVDEIHAKVENGVTTLYLPKVTPTTTRKENRKIEIA
jgi:HSP20 family protein